MKLHIITILMVYIAMVFGCDKSKIDDAKYKASPIQVTTENLVNEFESNPVAAKAKYKDKLIKVSGFIEKISEQKILGDTVFSIMFARHNQGISVFSHHSESERNIFVTLKPGQSVSILCLNTELTESKTVDNILSLSDCRF